eukprot:Skav235411  [mRNA]  locus=scaffold924:28849:29546:+ [translate_table: standard]
MHYAAEKGHVEVLSALAAVGGGVEEADFGFSQEPGELHRLRGDRGDATAPRQYASARCSGEWSYGGGQAAGGSQGTPGCEELQGPGASVGRVGLIGFLAGEVTAENR